MEKSKILMTEATRKIFERELPKNVEEMDVHELAALINSTKKLVAKITESGEIKVKQILLG